MINILDNNLHAPIIRPSWVESHMNIAEEASNRSCDFNTKVGAVIVDPYEHIIGTGYNSFPRNFPDNLLPNLRDPTGIKNLLMVHAEINCIINTTVSPFLFPQGVSLYCTEIPCIRCLGPIINANIRYIYYKKQENREIPELELVLFDDLIRLSGIKCVRVS